MVTNQGDGWQWWLSRGMGSQDGPTPLATAAGSNPDILQTS
jgi:hypothetical protein